MRRAIIAGISAVIICCGAVGAADESFSSTDPNDGWKFAAKPSDVAIYSRLRAGSPVKEFRGVGLVDAPSRAVHAVIDDLENYPKFMPYTAECRLIKRESDSSIITYQRVSPKICGDRDYTLRIKSTSWPVANGVAYLNSWSPANELGPPEKKGVVRVRSCEGSWLLEPIDEKQTRATYSVYSDTGGAIPAFLANHASQTAIAKIFVAIRKQVNNAKYSTVAD
jgi:hypothetical protein